MELKNYFNLMVEKNASDMFFSVGAPVNIKIEGYISPIGTHSLPPGSVKEIANEILNEQQIETFESTLEMNLALTYEKLGRFRINFYKQRGEVAMVVRYIKPEVMSLEELNLPPVLKELIMLPQGLVLVVGSTGSGKSTTLAAMIDYRNQNRTGHILTIEDPIEYMYRHKKSIVDQREIGVDTMSYENALKNAMREAPDVILIGEIRDRETMQAAIAYANTGHLCLSTLHSNNANQTLDRIINFFPDSAHQQLHIDLAQNLKAVISQRLVSGKDEKRIPAMEIMLSSPYVAQLIEKGDVNHIKDAMVQSGNEGMQTFDESLYDLYKKNMITEEEALLHADSHNNLGLKIRLEKGGDAGQEDQFTIN
ncbi:MAG: PilT/PilU family type 4a pilus ATPase [Gammaproteobacteria bacterium]|nr:PilT/PilU family type 4a pilus ATPase [Gammaproteobacteria bacterium]